MSKKILWWGYTNHNKQIIVKKFDDYADIINPWQEAHIAKIFEPFMASNKEEAIENIKQQILKQ